MRRQEELRRMEEIHNQEVQKRKQQELRIEEEQRRREEDMRRHNEEIMRRQQEAGFKGGNFGNPENVSVFVCLWPRHFFAVKHFELHCFAWKVLYK